MAVGSAGTRKMIEEHCREFNAMVRGLQRIKNNGDDWSSAVAKKVLERMKREDDRELTVRCVY